MDLKTKASAKTRGKIEKLAEIVQKLYQGNDYNITRLTTLKSLCDSHDIAIRFVYHLACCTAKRMEKKQTPSNIEPKLWVQHKELVKKAILQVDHYLGNKNDSNIKLLRVILDQLTQLQNTYENQRWGSVRIIESSDTLLVEKSIKCILSPEDFRFRAYHVGREYAEKYDSHYGTGLIPDSAPLMEDIVQFWVHYYRLENIVILKKI